MNPFLVVVGVLGAVALICEFLANLGRDLGG